MPFFCEFRGLFRSGRLLWVAAVLLIWGAESATAQTLSVGNLIYLDANGNRVPDAGEGVVGVTVQLFEDGDVPGEASPVASTETIANGVYGFTGVAEGTYFIHVPALEFLPGGDLAGALNLPGQSGLAADDDVGEDGLEEGVDPTVDGLSSDIFDLEADSAPTGLQYETGFQSETDDGDDENSDLTIDLGFYRPVGVGNRVFLDANNNGVANAGEGLTGITVRLFREGANPAVDEAEAEQQTGANGSYLFSNVVPGSYFVQVPASEFSAGRPLSGMAPLPGTSPLADDDAGEDTLAAAQPEVTGVRTETFALARGSMPTTISGETGQGSTVDDAEDANVDLTRDLGFALPAGKVGVGNLVFIDENSNGVADLGEGRNGVRVQLFLEGDDPQTASPSGEQLTAGGGRFLFNGLTPGNYLLHIPVSEFGLDGPLYGAFSVPGQDSADQDDHVGEDGRDDQTAVASGVSTGIFTLAVGGMPTAATTELGQGATADDVQDADVDLTRDFGFVRLPFDPVGVGNAVFFDANTNGAMDAGEGVDGVTVQLFMEGMNAQTARPLATRDTQAGIYYFEGLQNGRYFVHIPAAEFQSGGALEGKQSMTGNGGDNGIDDDADENGLDPENLTATGISSGVFDLTADTEPEEGTEDGIESDYDDLDDDNFDLTIDFGFQIECPQIVITPAVLPEGKQGEHYEVAFEVNGGAPGYTFAWFTDSDFPSGLSLAANGVLSGTPADVGPYQFRVRATAGDGCAAEVTRTVLINPPPRPVGVGNVVFVDADGDGRYDSGEGRESVTVQLFSEGDDASVDAPVAELVTDPGGKYHFMGLDEGRYFVHVPAAEFQVGGDLEAMTSSPGVGEDNGLDDDVGEDGVDAYRPEVTGVSSIVFELKNGTEPIDSPTGQVAQGFETGFDFSTDNLADADQDMTIDLGFIALPPGGVGVGNLVFFDADRNGVADPGEGVEGVTVRLFLDGANPQVDPPVSEDVTEAGGFYLFTGLPQGRYFLHVPASDFSATGVLKNRISIAGVGNLLVKRDDEKDENGLDEADPTVGGIVSAPFDLFAYIQPTNAAGEFGLGATMDDAEDEHVDLTQDLGFDIFCPAMTVQPSTFVSVQRGSNFSVTLTASGGTAPYTWSGDNLPLWVVLTPQGQLTATPPDAGSFPLALRATDAEGCRVEVERTLVVTAPPVGTLGVGNLVFIDANKSGAFDAGEGVDGVVVQLYAGTATPGTNAPLVSRATANGGQFLFDELFAGDYFLRISPENFAPGALLANTESLPGTGAALDDDVAEDGLDPVNILTTGVRTPVFTLAAGTAPTGATFETGGFSESDDARDADIDLTQDFGFVSQVSGSFIDWQAENSLGGANGPEDNPDGDFESNLMEYALGDAADSALRSGRAFIVRVNAENQLQAIFTRPVPRRPDINYLVEGTTDEPGPDAVWGQIDPPAPLAVPVDGGEQLIYNNLQNLLFFGGAKKAYLRLRVDLDVNQDAIPELTTHSPAWGFNLLTMAGRSQTMGMPLAAEALVVGTVDSINGSVLDLTTAVGSGDLRTLLTADRPYYVEVLSGAATGHRWEVNVAGSGAKTIALSLTAARNTQATVPAGVAGATVALRPHWRIADLFPTTRLKAGANDRNAAKVTVYDVPGQAFAPLWLFANGGSPLWLYVGDTSFADAGQRVLDVGEGCFVAPGSQSVLVPLVGQAREHAVIQNLPSGVSLRAGTWTGPKSPAALGLTVANGFFGATSATAADRIRFWDGDAAAVESYTGYFLLEAPSVEKWVKQGDGAVASANAMTLFQPFRAFFMTRVQGELVWTIPFGPIAP